MLAATFAACLMAGEEHCAESFDIKIEGRCPPIPPDCGCPVPLRAESSASSYSVYVYLWHRRGLVTGVEVSAHGGGDHPALGELPAGEWNN
jgi:hypothetical protein